MGKRENKSTWEIQKPDTTVTQKLNASFENNKRSKTMVSPWTEKTRYESSLVSTLFWMYKEDTLYSTSY